MIDKVIVCGVRRISGLISKTELTQMVGRAGRSYTKSGTAYVMAMEHDVNKTYEMLNGINPPVVSKMDDLDNVAFHFLPQIVNNKGSKEEFALWYSKSLAYSQGFHVDYDEVIECLKEFECVEFFCGRLIATPLGRVSSGYYYLPARLSVLKNRILELSDTITDIESIVSEVIAWMLAYDEIYIGSRVSDDIMSNFTGKLKHHGHFLPEDSVVHGFLFYCMLNEQKPKEFAYAIDTVRRDAGRLLSACRKIASAYCPSFERVIDYADISLSKNVSLDVAKIMFKCGIKQKGVAKEVYELGIRNREDFVENIDYIKESCSSSSKRAIELMEL